MKAFVPHLNHLHDGTAFRERIAAIPRRIVVEGTRGKSSAVEMIEATLRVHAGAKTLAKTTGEHPLLIHNGEHIPLYRERETAVFLDFDNIPPILEFDDIDTLIYENQAITPYTMQYVHELIHPQHVIIPNIRIDHPEGLGDDLHEMTVNFTKNMLATPSKKEVYYGEVIRQVHDIVVPVFREFEEQYPDLITFHDIPIPKRKRHLPGAETAYLLDYFMEYCYGIRLGPEVFLEQITDRFTIRQGPQGVEYFDGAKINDPISFIQVMNYILPKTGKNFSLVAYFRPDRVDRVRIFEDFTREINERFGDRIDHIWLAGHGTHHFRQMMPDELKDRTTGGATEKDLCRIVETAAERDTVIVTMVNRVNPFMDCLMALLEGKEPKEGCTICKYDPVTGLPHAHLQPMDY